MLKRFQAAGAYTTKIILVNFSMVVYCYDFYRNKINLLVQCAQRQATEKISLTLTIESIVRKKRPGASLVEFQLKVRNILQPSHYDVTMILEICTVLLYYCKCISRFLVQIKSLKKFKWCNAPTFTFSTNRILIS